MAGGLNLYGFAGGDPVSYSDPFGLCPKSLGGDGKTEDKSDCPTNDPAMVKKADSVGKAILAEDMSAIRGVVVGEALAVGEVGALVKNALERQALKIVGTKLGQFSMGYTEGYLLEATPMSSHLQAIDVAGPMRWGLRAGKYSAKAVAHRDAILQALKHLF